MKKVVCVSVTPWLGFSARPQENNSLYYEFSRAVLLIQVNGKGSTYPRHTTLSIGYTSFAGINSYVIFYGGEPCDEKPAGTLFLAEDPEFFDQFAWNKIGDFLTLMQNKIFIPDSAQHNGRELWKVVDRDLIVPGQKRVKPSV